MWLLQYNGIELKNAASVILAMELIYNSEVKGCGYRVSGFDIEYNGGSEGTPRIPQLLTIVVDKNVLLVRLDKEGKNLINGDRFPKSLVDFLTDESYIKCGVGICGDVALGR